MLLDLIRAISASRMHASALYLLSNVPGFPPIVQTVHILSVSAIMGSIVLIDLKILGLALPTQNTEDLVRRLMPLTWWALPTLAASGLVFILAQPQRYFVNPIFGIKFALLAPAIVLSAIVQRTIARGSKFRQWTPGRRAWVRVIAAVSLLLWIGVAMAGRWIAYADYLFPGE
jgi:hypothetical protein